MKSKIFQMNLFGARRQFGRGQLPPHAPSWLRHCYTDEHVFCPALFGASAWVMLNWLIDIGLTKIQKLFDLVT